MRGVIMNIREWIVPVLLAIITTWFVQKYVIDRWLRPVDPRAEHSFIAPNSEKPLKPLRTAIDFIDAEKARAEEIVEVATSWGAVAFSSHGAVISALDFNHTINGTYTQLRTIYPHTTTDREQQAFIIGLNCPTPYYYTFVGQQELEGVTKVTYRASYAYGTLTKTFIVHHDACKVDLECAVTCGNGCPDGGVELRIGYPAPYLMDIGGREQISGLLITQDGVFEKIDRSKIVVDKGWFSPQIFGAESTYFIHALVADPENAIQRAYYKVIDQYGLITILETKPVVDEQIYTFSFYCGPKTDAAVAAVDSRLEKALGYAGYFAPLARFFLWILVLLFGIFHNYGIAIIVLTILLKLILLPLTVSGDARMKQQQEMAERLTFVKQKYKDNPERLAQEQAALIKKYGFPGIGCFPLLLQIPIFIAIRGVLSNALELYQAPFLWIPDLSVRDPYYILPLVLVLAMFVQAAYAEKAQRMTIITMGLVFGALMAQFAAGLVLYFVMHSVLTVLQTRVVRWFKRA